MILKKLVPLKQAGNQHLNGEVLERLSKSASFVRPQIEEKLKKHYDNAPCRTHGFVNHRIFGNSSRFVEASMQTHRILVPMTSFCFQCLKNG